MRARVNPEVDFKSTFLIQESRFLMEPYIAIGILLAGLKVPTFIISTILIKKNPDATWLLGVSGILTVGLVLAWPLVLVVQVILIVWKVEIK